MASHFADRLCQSVKSKSTPLVVGLDPVYARLPESIRSHPEMNDEFDVAAAIESLLGEGMAHSSGQTIFVRK